MFVCRSCYKTTPLRLVERQASEAVRGTFPPSILRVPWSSARSSALRLSHASSSARRLALIRAIESRTRPPVSGHLTFSSRSRPRSVLFKPTSSSHRIRVVSHRIVSFPCPLVSALPISVPALSRRSAARVQHTLPLLSLSLVLSSPPPLLRPRVPFWDRDPPWITQPELALQ